MAALGPDIGPAAPCVDQRIAAFFIGSGVAALGAIAGLLTPGLPICLTAVAQLGANRVDAADSRGAWHLVTQALKRSAAAALPKPIGAGTALTIRVNRARYVGANTSLNTTTGATRNCSLQCKPK